LKTSVDLSELPVISSPGRIAILKSKWYPELVSNLSKVCVQTLSDHGYTDITEHTLPGSVEIPLAARDLLALDADAEIDAVICFGVIVKGATYHFEMISNETMRGLGQVMHEFRRPVVVEILPVYDIKDAQERCADDQYNKGYEAAAAAIEMVAWRRSVGCA